MDQLIAILTGIYPREKSAGTPIDTVERKREVPRYVTSCGACLHQRKATGRHVKLMQNRSDMADFLDGNCSLS